jgi:hypothetical protein
MGSGEWAVIASASMVGHSACPTGIGGLPV